MSIEEKKKRGDREMGFLDRLVGNKPEKTEKQIQAEQKSRAAEIRGENRKIC